LLHSDKAELERRLKTWHTGLLCRRRRQQQRQPRAGVRAALGEVESEADVLKQANTELVQEGWVMKARVLELERAEGGAGGVAGHAGEAGGDAGVLRGDGGRCEALRARLDDLEGPLEGLEARGEGCAGGVQTRGLSWTLTTSRPRGEWGSWWQGGDC